MAVTSSDSVPPARHSEHLSVLLTVSKRITPRQPRYSPHLLQQVCQAWVLALQRFTRVDSRTCVSAYGGVKPGLSP